MMSNEEANLRRKAANEALAEFQLEIFSRADSYSSTVLAFYQIQMPLESRHLSILVSASRP